MFKRKYNLQLYLTQQKMLKLYVACIALMFILGSTDVITLTVLSEEGEKPFQKADVIYYNGDIITMDDSCKSAQYIAIADGKIIAVGEQQLKMSNYVGQNTKVINLHGRTLLPGFIDAHSHFGMTAIQLNQGFDIACPPFGTVSSISDIINNVRTYIETNKIPAGKSIYGAGYSDIDVIDHRHPTRFDLDAISTIHPLCLRHFSGHVITCNSLALATLGYTDATPNPPGGYLQHFPNGTITGVAKQLALIPFLKFATNFWNLTNDQINVATQHYVSCGVTTTHDVMSSMIEPIVYKGLGDDFPLDVNGYYWINSLNLTNFDNAKKYATKRFKVKGAKFIIDGSIQARTALLTSPYWVPKEIENTDLTNYTYDDSRSCLTESCGSNDFPASTLMRNLFLNFYNSQTDVLVHCNGDQASQNMIEAVKWARDNSNLTKDTRFVMIHSQNVRDDQLDRFAALGITPSFFPGHIYYWGDRHYNVFLGPKRARRMNPVASALKRNLTFTLHNDSPTIVMGNIKGINTFLHIAASAVIRKTSSGLTLGEDQRISVYDALKGLTINSAWQSREQDTKGSLEVGKIADLVILSQNPMNVKPEELLNINVLTTIKEGKIIYGSYPKGDCTQAEIAV